MTAYQRAKRIARLRGSFLALTIFSLWLVLSALGGSVTE